MDAGWFLFIGLFVGVLLAHRKTVTVNVTSSQEVSSESSSASSGSSASGSPVKSAGKSLVSLAALIVIGAVAVTAITAMSGVSNTAIAAQVVSKSAPQQQPQYVPTAPQQYFTPASPAPSASSESDMSGAIIGCVVVVIVVCLIVAAIKSDRAANRPVPIDDLPNLFTDKQKREQPQRTR